MDHSQLGAALQGWNWGNKYPNLILLLLPSYLLDWLTISQNQLEVRG